jgi:translation initiation factor 1
MSNNSRLVYSTDAGRIKSEPSTAKEPAAATGDGIVRLHRQTKGRKGKGVTLVTGLALPDADLKALAKQLKQLCGTGGSVKEGQIEIQGDQRAKLKDYLEEKGYRVKLAGG